MATAVFRVDRNTPSNVKPREAYSDFMCDFTPHPNTEDLTRITNESAIARSMRNLILTNKGERFFSKVGGNVTRFLFEPISDITSTSIRTAIEDTIKNHEPRVKLVQVEVKANDINQSYYVSIVYYVINRPEPSNLVITLYRVR